MLAEKMVKTIFNYICLDWLITLHVCSAHNKVFK